MPLTAASETGKPKLSLFEDFALAGAAAVFSKTTAAPIERVKLLVQNQYEMIKAGRIAERYKGVIDCVWLIVLDTSQCKLLILRLKIKLRLSSNPIRKILT